MSGNRRSLGNSLFFVLPSTSAFQHMGIGSLIEFLLGMELRQEMSPFWIHNCIRRFPSFFASKMLHASLIEYGSVEKYCSGNTAKLDFHNGKYI